MSRFSVATGLGSAALQQLPLQRGRLKELAIFDNAPAQRMSVVLTGYDNNIGVQPFAKHVEEQLPAVRRLFAANVRTGNQEVIEYEAEGHTGAYKSIKTKHLELVPIPFQVHACGEGGQKARVKHTQNFWRDFRGNSDHMHSQSKLMLLNFNVKNSPERGYLTRLSEGWDFADAPHGDTQQAARRRRLRPVQLVQVCRVTQRGWHRLLSALGGDAHGFNPGAQNPGRST